MYIEPNTIIRVLSNCPLDNTYDHTIYFSSPSEQASYFQTLTKYTFSEQTYQRVNSGVMRVQRKADDLYDCNYIMFQNSSFGSKWFYAFITSIEYVNNITSQITYQLDVMQTWAFNYELLQCFVEREHSSTDEIGDNLVPENLEMGDYISDGLTNAIPWSGPTTDYSIVIAATFDKNYQDIAGTLYTGVFQGLMFHVFPNDADGSTQAAQFIIGAVGAGKQDGIVSLFLMPSPFVPIEAFPGPRTYNINSNKNYTTIDGYTPKNKKLFTYPFNFLYCTNFQGNSTAFRYEYFSGEQCTFNLIGDMSCNPSVILRPTNYKGAEINNDEKMVLSGFPQLAYNTDSFKAWLAQNATSLGVNVASTGLSAALTGAITGGTGAVVGAAAGVAVSIASVLAQVMQAEIAPNQSHTSGSTLSYALADILDFGFMKKHIRAEFAKIIDDYFNMFGYATHRVKVPNINVRPHWTYTKTLGCVVEGSLPADDMRKICNIYNNGITHWVNPSEIGNYSLDNSPVGG